MIFFKFGFKERNQLFSRLLQGERADAPIAMADEFRAFLPVLLAGYEPCNILNADEVDLFYEATGKRSFVLQGNDPVGTKESKKKITMLIMAAMDVHLEKLYINIDPATIAIAYLQELGVFFTASGKHENAEACRVLPKSASEIYKVRL